MLPTVECGSQLNGNGDVLSADAPLLTKTRHGEAVKGSVAVPRTLDPDGAIADRLKEGRARDLRFTEDNVVTYSEFLMADGA